MKGTDPSTNMQKRTDPWDSLGNAACPHLAVMEKTLQWKIFFGKKRMTGMEPQGSGIKGTDP